MILKVQYRKVVHEIQGSDARGYFRTIAKAFHLSESRMKILYRGKVVGTEEEVDALVKSGKILYLIGTPSKEQLDANVRCKYLRRIFMMYVMVVFEMSLVQVPLKVLTGLLNGIKLFFVSMIKDPNCVREANSREGHEPQQASIIE